jgi:hypothetical protein
MERGINERDHGLADFMVLLAVVVLGLVAWVCLSDATSPARWKVFFQFMPAVVFALAALTRHPSWAMAFRFLTGGWVVVAPFILGFADISLAVRADLAIGVLVIMASLPRRPALPEVR